MEPEDAVLRERPETTTTFGTDQVGRLGWVLACRSRGRTAPVLARDEIEEELGYPVRPDDMIDMGVLDRVRRHLGADRVTWLLGNRDAALGVDRGHAGRAVVER